MRTIEFRGKRIDNGEWVIGQLVKMWGEWHILNSDNVNTAYSVDSATIGQYTGMKDKNGKEIYEGDILQDEMGFKGEISYSMAAFYGDFGEGIEPQYFSEGLHEACIVIGNIHDNPELLKGGEQ